MRVGVVLIEPRVRDDQCTDSVLFIPRLHLGERDDGLRRDVLAARQDATRVGEASEVGGVDHAGVEECPLE